MAEGTRQVVTGGKVYKVWLEVEEYDVETGEGVTVDGALSGSSLATFATEAEAVAFAEQVQAAAEGTAANTVEHEG